MDKVPADEQQKTQWELPQDDLVLLAIVGIKVCAAIWSR
jgi:Ca2+-transporting ATPase